MSSQEYEAKMSAGSRKMLDATFCVLFSAITLVTGILLALELLLEQHWLGALCLPLGIGGALFLKQRSVLYDRQACECFDKAGEINVLNTREQFGRH